MRFFQADFILSQPEMNNPLYSGLIYVVCDRNQCTLQCGRMYCIKYLMYDRPSWVLKKLMTMHFHLKGSDPRFIFSTHWMKPSLARSGIHLHQLLFPPSVHVRGNVFIYLGILLYLRDYFFILTIMYKCILSLRD